MQCHKCQWREKIERGDYRDTPWEETPCSQCELVESSVGTMEYNDELIPPDVLPEFMDSLLPISVMAEVVNVLLSQPPKTFRILCLRYKGKRYWEIGHAVASSVSAVEVRHRRAMDHWPILEEIFPVKAAKRIRRHVSVCGGRNGAGCQKRLKAGGNTGQTIQSRKNKCKRKTVGRGKKIRPKSGRGRTHASFYPPTPRGGIVLNKEKQ
jgi:hypothetical protein